MEINKLKTFVELASTLSFSKTAANLFINQSSVSKQIKSLERELNCELFIRAKRQIRMTEYAKILFPAAQKIIKLNDQTLSDLRNCLQDRDDKIIIGVLPTFWNYSFFDQISNFKRQNPNLRIIIKEGEINYLTNLFQQVKLDFAFVRTTYGYKSDFEEFTVDHESFCACLNYEHPLATKKSLKLADLKNENFVFYSGEEMFYHTVFDLCRESGVEPQFSFASHNIKLILNLVKNNEGISILMHAPGKTKDVTYVPIKPAFSTRLVCVRQPNQATKIASDFWNYLVK